MLNRVFVEEKLGHIRNYLLETEEIIKLDSRRILGDFRNLRTLEREVQLIVDEILNINIHLIRELDLKSPDDFQSSFEILADAGVISNAFSLKIAPVVGLRNRLVHRYEEINQELFVKLAKKNYKDFIEYIKHINTFLKRSQKARN